LEVNAEAGTIVDPQFADAQPHRTNIPGMAKSKSIKSRSNQSANPLVLKSHAPFSESLGLFEFSHFDFRSL
jgi:hypothetical protein